MRYSEYMSLEDSAHIRPPSFFCQEDCDRIQNVGWEQTKEGNEKIDFLFSQKNLDYLSETITEALQGVDPEGRDIIIPHQRICDVLTSIYERGARPNVGDIHSRYIIEPINDRNDILEINNQTISIIVSYIKNEIEMTENNKKLNIFDATVLGDFNVNGLRAHPPIKIKKRRVMPMAFQMNY